MSKDFLGAGWKFPVRVSPRGGTDLSRYEEDIKESIRIILETARGERVMRPDFGCGIHDLIFEPITPATESMIIHEVTDALNRFEPRIEVTNVEVSREEAHMGRLLVLIDYKIISTNTASNLVYPFYLGE